MQRIIEVQAPYTLTPAQIGSLYQRLQAVPEYRGKRGRRYEAATAQAFVAEHYCEHDCAGKVITADALHTRPRFCRQIRRQQGEYVLVVKGNRPALEAEIRQLFALAPDPDYPVQTVRTVDKGMVD